MKTFSSLYTFVCAALFSNTVYAAPSSTKQAFNWYEIVQGSSLQRLRLIITFVLDRDDIKYVYAFGDSYSFIQGTEGYANYSFIGDAFNVSFTPEELLRDRIVPKNVRSSYLAHITLFL
jgi:hypothetical protein